MPKLDESIAVVDDNVDMADQTKSKAKAKAKPKAKAKVKETKKSKKKTGERRVRAEGERSVNSDKPKREPVWNDRRKAIIMSLRKLGATSVTTAVTAGKIAETASKMKEFPEAKVLGDKTETSHGPKGLWFTKWHLSYSLPDELTHNGFVESTRVEGERELVYFLTSKGKTTKFPAKEKKTKKDEE